MTFSKTEYYNWTIYFNSNNVVAYIIVSLVKLFIGHTVIPLGFFKQSPFNGCLPSAHKHLIFLSLVSTAHDVYGVSKQSESVVHSWTGLLAEKSIIIILIYFSLYSCNIS